MFECKEKKVERPGREIKIDGSELGNENVTVRIGTAENKNNPNTIYINLSFWVDIKERNDEFRSFDTIISRKYSKELHQIYRHNLRNILENNRLFPYYFENIYMYDFPENLNYNNKRSFTSIELNLHTINCKSSSNVKYDLKNSSDNELYSEATKIAKVILSTPLLKGELDFSIHKRKK
jgi:hypothetical protein